MFSMRQVDEFFLQGAAVAAGYAVSFVTPIVPFMIGLTLLVGGGMLMERKALQRSGKRYNAERMKRVIDNTNDYFLLLIMSRVMEMIFFNYLPVTYIVASYIGLVEFKRIHDNFQSLTDVNVWERFKQFIPNGIRIKGFGAKTDRAGEDRSGGS
jgi:hypothetical protein